MDVYNYIQLKKLIGEDVINSLGQKYGKVHDFIISPEGGRVLALIMATDGFLGTRLGADYTAIPWHGVRVNPNSHTVSCSIDKAIIEDAPEFKLEHLREGRREAFNQLYDYYGIERIYEKMPREKQPMKPGVQQGQDVGERNPTNEGSYQITQNYPEEKDTKEEVDYDKIKGVSQQKKGSSQHK